MRPSCRSCIQDPPTQAGTAGTDDPSGLGLGSLPSTVIPATRRCQRARYPHGGARRHRLPQAAGRAPLGPAGHRGIRRPGDLPGQLHLRPRPGRLPDRPWVQARCRHRAGVGRLRSGRHRRGDPDRLERRRPRHPGRHHRPHPSGAAPRPAPVPLGPWREVPLRARAGSGRAAGGPLPSLPQGAMCHRQQGYLVSRGDRPGDRPKVDRRRHP
jgi:hypothetical protein